MKKIDKTGYCYKCDDFKKFVIKETKKKVTVLDKTFVVSLKVCHCESCSGIVTANSVDKENEITVYDKYKELSGLLTSNDIKSILNKRNLTQLQLADILNIGEKDLTRYINGKIQTRQMDNLLRLVNDDIAYSRILEIFNKKPLKGVLTN